MKMVRSNRYRRRRRRTDRERILIVAAIIGGSVLVAAAAVVLCLILLFHRPSSEQTETVSTSVVSEEATISTVSSTAAPSDAIIAINSNAATAISEGELAYQSLYPDLYVPIVAKIPAKEGDKVVYLTFDEAPSDQTTALLNALKQANVKATFFVSAQDEMTDEKKALIKSIADAGHTIGIYAYTSDRTALYRSVADYLADFNTMSNLIYEITGVKPTIFRFPGGSYNNENAAIHEALIAELERRGYTYFDWNVDAGDSASNATEGSIYQNTVEGITSHNKSIVLLNNGNGKSATVAQIPAILAAAQQAGYRFAVLDPSVKPFSFAYPEA